MLFGTRRRNVPSPYDSVALVDTSNTLPKRELNTGPLPDWGIAMDRFGKVVSVRKTPSSGATRALSVQSQLHCIQECGFSTAIECTKQDHGSGAIRCQCDLVPPFVHTEVVEN
jgi:hypothetical protein